MHQQTAQVLYPCLLLVARCVVHHPMRCGRRAFLWKIRDVRMAGRMPGSDGFDPVFVQPVHIFVRVHRRFQSAFFADSGRMEAERDGDEIAGPAAAGGGCLGEEEKKVAEDGQVRSEQKLAAAAGSQEQELARRIDQIAELHKLTVREKEVLELVYDGYTNPDIAEALFISINTVKKHIRNIYEKLGVNSRMETVHLVNARSRWK
ncbi:LuxR family transcriptional regulator [Clostridiales bacterium]|nr:LuxR family transcriptional regulator [Clostridiales bacterium]